MCSVKKDVSKISQISQENTCVGKLFLIKLQVSACNFIKKRPDHRCFHVKFAKYLKTPILENIVNDCFCLTSSWGLNFSKWTRIFDFWIQHLAFFCMALVNVFILHENILSFLSPCIKLKMWLVFKRYIVNVMKIIFIN